MQRPLEGHFWQITPQVLLEHMAGDDRARSKRVFEAMMEMVKIDVAGIEKAAEGSV